MKSKSNKLATAPIGMSSDVDDDQVLPESLQKLEIVSVYANSLAACKTINKRHQNPFLPELSTASCIDDRITKDLFGPSCSNCKSTDKSCTVNSMNSSGNDMENRNWRYHGSNSSGSNSSGTGEEIMHSINKTIRFKHRDREKTSSQLLSEKKLAILREPILKSIGRSAYHNGNQNKLCCEPKSCCKHQSPNDERTNIANSAAAGSRPEVTHTTAAASTGAMGRHKSCDHCRNKLVVVTDGVHGTVTEYRSDSSSRNKIDCQRVAETSSADLNNVMIHEIQNWRLANDASVVDFKSLVNECSKLTLCAHETSAAHNSIIELHKTRNFQILQANQIDDTTAVSSNDTNDMHLLSTSDGLHSSAMLTTNVNNAVHCSLNDNNNNSNNSSNSSSCSQQARMNSSNCDVTIDELASYIEFQLHLPKPMSSNVYEAMFS